MWMSGRGSRACRRGGGCPSWISSWGAHGLRLGHVPQSYEWATVGGCAATRSAGQASTGVGRFEALVAAMRCVTPLGELATLPVPASAAGPSLRELVLGSEGRLGVITELTLRVVPLPAAEHFEAWLVPGFETGCEVLRALAQARAAPDIARLSDEEETATTVAISGGRAFGRCLLICGWEGGTGRRRAGGARAGPRRRTAAGPEAGRGVARHPLRGAALPRRAARPRGAGRDARDGDDLVGPGARCTRGWGRRCARRSRRRHRWSAATSRTCIASGASLYFTVLARQDGADPAGQWRAAKRAATDAVVAAGGTLTHHHAIGTEHRPWLAAEHGELGVELLRAAAQRCDPAGIMNPGKLLPD